MKEKKRVIFKQGYVWIFFDGYHRRADKRGYVPEHILVAEREILGRPLKDDELVMRNNNDRQDNRRENLYVTTTSVREWLRNK